MKKLEVSLITMLFLIAILFAGCDSKTTFLQESTKKEDKAMELKLDKIMKDCVTQKKFSGSVLVAKGDDILLDRGYGMSDYDKKILCKPQTIFEIGSITKQFTATAILMLEEKGLLSVNDSLSKYIPDYPKGDKIKIYNLLNHTSGIIEYLQIIEAQDNVKSIYTPNELIELFKNKPLEFDPGTSFMYSSSNYLLLGYIIEKVSGMKYADYLEKNIFKPLKMNNTGCTNSKVNIKDKAIGYSMVMPGYNIKQKENDGTLEYSGGNIYSTVEDMFKWSNALFSGKLIKEASLNKMLTPNLSDYGFAWIINKAKDGSKIVYHTGGVPGFISIIERNVNKNYSIILLCNNEEVDHNIITIPQELYNVIDKKN
jgi:CubicO group peptidase (beta-lactamase class C family)